MPRGRPKNATGDKATIQPLGGTHSPMVNIVLGAA